METHQNMALYGQIFWLTVKWLAVVAVCGVFLYPPSQPQCLLHWCSLYLYETFLMAHQHSSGSIIINGYSHYHYAQWRIMNMNITASFESSQSLYVDDVISLMSVHFNVLWSDFNWNYNSFFKWRWCIIYTINRWCQKYFDKLKKCCFKAYESFHDKCYPFSISH